MRSRNIKWAAGGFILGFPLCYALFDLLNPQAYGSKQFATATQSMTAAPGRTPVLSTNSLLTEIHIPIATELRWAITL